MPHEVRLQHLQSAKSRAEPDPAQLSEGSLQQAARVILPKTESSRATASPAMLVAVQVPLGVAASPPDGLAYKLWWRARDENSTWEEIATGTRSEGGILLKPDIRRGGQLAYWIGLRGRPGQTYQVVLTLTQSDGVVIAAVPVSMMTDANGAAHEEDYLSVTPAS